jgi:hypothetical protein
MADIAASNWSETDASNTTASPDGMPEGMAPSGVNNWGRAVAGAVKRFWNKANAVKTTAGTTSAYTLAYDVAPGAYYDGEIISFVVNATNAAAATLNVNALGAIPLRLFGGNLLAGALLANQIVQARYSTSAGAFDILPQGTWTRLGTQDPSAAATVDFTGIPAGVNNLMVCFDWTPGTDAVSMAMQTYDAAGNLDTGASDYAYVATIAANGSSNDTGDDANSSIVLTGTNNTIDNSASFGIGGTIHLSNIQAARVTKATWSISFLDSAGSQSLSGTGMGWRGEADRITGLRFIFSSGTGTGKFTLYAGA